MKAMVCSLLVATAGASFLGRGARSGLRLFNHAPQRKFACIAHSSPQDVVSLANSQFLRQAGIKKGVTWNHVERLKKHFFIQML